MKKNDALEVREYQQDAVNSALINLKKDSRCQLHMAPGSGKTIISLQIHEKRKSKSTLFCTPSIHLVYQTLKSWAKFRSTKYSALVVCSGRMSKADKEELAELRASNVVVSTDAKEIGEFLSRKGKKVIFSTYKSLMKIATAVNQSNFSFDLGIFDEAHHIAGHTEKDATVSLKDDIIPIKKRSFLTATPRVATNIFKGDDNWLGMEKKEHYGEVAYTFPFRTAVNDHILTDYKLLITLVDKETVDSFSVDATAGGVVATFNEKVALVGTSKVVIDKGLKKGLTFHNSIKKASSFSAYLRDAFTKLDQEDSVYIDTLNCNHGINHKAGVLKSLETNEVPSIITNVNVLGEGYDFSALEFIVIVDPKSSQIEIVQNIGRVMRIHPGKEIGTIILPVVAEGDADELELAESSHGAIVKVIKALKSYDVMLTSEIGKSHKGCSTFKEYKQFVLDKVEILSVGDEKKLKGLYERIKLKVVDIATGSVDKWILELEEWCEKHQRLPAINHRDHECAETKLSKKMQEAANIKSQYSENVRSRVNNILDKYRISPPDNSYSSTQIAKIIGIHPSTIGSHIDSAKYPPTATITKHNRDFHYYGEDVLEAIRLYYCSDHKAIRVKDVINRLNICIGSLNRVRTKHNIEYTIKHGMRKGWVSHKMFKWLDDYFKCGASEPPARAGVLRKAFVNSNPPPS